MVRRSYDLQITVVAVVLLGVMGEAGDSELIPGFTNLSQPGQGEEHVPGVGSLVAARMSMVESWLFPPPLHFVDKVEAAGDDPDVAEALRVVA
jgi:hypothetical protein